jgi:SAM-dependent methyltransferase
VALWRSVSKLPPSPRVLDAGCGAGRNALYLAQQGCHVEAVDSSAAALRLFRGRLSAVRWRELVKIRQVSLVPPLPFDSDFFDAALDIYVSCHFLEPGRMASHWNEIRRILVRGGFALAAFLGTQDQYYSRLISESSFQSSPVVHDPINGIGKRLYTVRQLEEFFGQAFTIHKSISLEFDDAVEKRVYRRQILGFLLQK